MSCFSTVELAQIPAFPGAEGFGVGTRLLRQDEIDRRVIQEVFDQERRIINDPSDVGCWINALGGTPYVDSDQDGMPDEWERMHQLNPNNVSDRNDDQNNNGYTNLEAFLNGTDPSDDQGFCFPILSTSGAISVVCL